jgi:BirA family biotin operon repressor/biotin-[acetyl-CoA-carboxylase] ligase
MTRWQDWSLEVVPSATSTSDLARQAAAAGAPAYSGFLALEQTAGRGRRGRRWVSRHGGMYLSVLLRPHIDRAQWFGFSFIAALAVFEAIQSWFTAPLLGANQPKMGLKWPNDIIVGGGKIAGILLEAGADYLIIGSGVNIAPVEGDPKTGIPPVSLAQFLNDAQAPIPTPDMLAAAYLDRLSIWYDVLVTSGFGPVRAAWLAHHAFAGQDLQVQTGEMAVRGRFVDLGMDGALVLLDDSGKTHHITTGDVQLFGD